MSVNRFEIMPLLLCAPDEALVSKDVLAGRPVAVIVDIREDWTTARSRVQPILDRRASDSIKAPTLLRIGMPDDNNGQDALSQLVALRPDGFVLSGCDGVADIQKLDAMLRVAEAENGMEAGSFAILAEVGEKQEFFLSPHSLRGISARLKGLIFDGAALARATASRANDATAGRLGAPALFARAATVLKASQAGLPRYELLAREPMSVEEVRAKRDISLADGFSGVIARSAAQLAMVAAG
jgi:citrate lyase subunit beta / citryl-CoA lyase